MLCGFILMDSIVKWKYSSILRYVISRLAVMVGIINMISSSQKRRNYSKDISHENKLFYHRHHGNSMQLNSYQVWNLLKERTLNRSLSYTSRHIVLLNLSKPSTAKNPVFLPSRQINPWLTSTAGFLLSILKSRTSSGRTTRNKNRMLIRMLPTILPPTISKRLGQQYSRGTSSTWNSLWIRGPITFHTLSSASKENQSYRLKHACTFTTPSWPSNNI